MKDLSMHLMDIAQNSVRAEATHVELDWTERKDQIVLTLTDNGKGMDAETLQKVTDPFFTSRTRRRVGLGLSLLEQNALRCNGRFCIESEPGKGTKVTAMFTRSHPDCPPQGNLAQTITLLMVGHPGIRFAFRYRGQHAGWETDSAELREAAGPAHFHLPQVIRLIQEIISDNLVQAGLEPQ